MKALQRNDYLIQNNCGWILRSKLSVLCYVVLKLVFILFCLFFLKLNKDNDCIFKYVSVVPDRERYHQPDLRPEVLTALSQCFTVTGTMQWEVGTYSCILTLFLYYLLKKDQIPLAC